MNSNKNRSYYEKYNSSRSQSSFQNSMSSYRPLNHYDRYKPLRAQYNFSNSANNKSENNRNQIIGSPNPRIHPYRKTYELNDRSNSIKNNFSIKNVPDTVPKTLKSSIEDEEEEKRKKKLSDLANKLLDKIKTWNTDSDLQNESNKSKTACEHQKSNSKNIEEINHKSSDAIVNSVSVYKFSSMCKEDKSKRISHSPSQKKECSNKKLESNKFDAGSDAGKSKKKLRKCNINKIAVEKLDNKIHHKLINQIMHMPKKSLENMLNDPKINPVMAAKISVLVKENKLLLAQKLRALAESKISQSTCPNQGEIMINIDNLIEPVVETDPSLLPDQFIKEMENIFQIQFHKSNDGNNVKSVMGEKESQTVFPDFNLPSTDSLEILTTSDEEVNVDTQHKNIKIENLADENINCNGFSHSVTFCNEIPILFDKTQADAEFDYEIITGDNDHENIDYNSILPKNKIENSTENINTVCESIKLENINENEGENVDLIDYNSSISLNDSFGEQSPESCKEIREEKLNGLSEEGLDCRVMNEDVNGYQYDQNSNVETEPIIQHFLPTDSSTSKGCQTTIASQTAATQTQLDSKELDDLLEIHQFHDFPVRNSSSSSSSRASLLKEIDFIQTLINKLSERRLKIFLELAKTNEEDGFVPGQFSSISLMETISNGNIHLINLLKQFFNSTQKA